LDEASYDASNAVMSTLRTNQPRDCGASTSPSGSGTDLADRWRELDGERPVVVDLGRCEGRYGAVGEGGGIDAGLSVEPAELGPHQVQVTVDPEVQSDRDHPPRGVRRDDLEPQVARRPDAGDLLDPEIGQVQVLRGSCDLTQPRHRVEGQEIAGDEAAAVAEAESS
jgi:hypothetical protein